MACHPGNRGIINRLLDLTSPEALLSFRSQTIQWSSILALQLLHLSPVKIDPRFSLVNKNLSNQSSSSTSPSPSKYKSPFSKLRRRKRKSKKPSSSQLSSLENSPDASTLLSTLSTPSPPLSTSKSCSSRKKLFFWSYMFLWKRWLWNTDTLFAFSLEKTLVFKLIFKWDRDEGLRI